MNYLGVDPGKHGAVAVLSTDGDVIEVFNFSKWTEREMVDYFMYDAQASRAILEKVHAMPGQGVTSMFSFGQAYGFVRSCLLCSRVSFDEAPPQKWQKALGIHAKGVKGAERKRLLKGKAQQLFPSTKVTLDNADALLIAEYCRRLFVRT